MPKSPPTSRFRRLRRDEAAVSEVVGYALGFGILSGILILSLIGFNDAQEDTAARVEELRAESAAQRVATAVIDAALLVEQQDVETYSRLVELPEDFDGRGYGLSLLADAVRVQTSTGADVNEPLLGAGLSVTLCTEGGPFSGRLLVRHDSNGPGACAGTDTLYLEEAA